MAITVQSRVNAKAPWGVLSGLNEFNDQLRTGRLTADEVKAHARDVLRRWQATIGGSYADMEFRIHDDAEAERQEAAPEPAVDDADVATHTFDLGEHVTIFNQTLGGKFIVEGVATIREIVDDVDECYMVSFDGDRRRKVQRFVDPAGQDDPQGHVDRLNRATRAA